MQCHWKYGYQVTGKQPGSVCVSVCVQPLYFWTMGTKGGDVVKFSSSFLCRILAFYCLFVPVSSIQWEQSTFSLNCLRWILSRQLLRPRRWRVICCLSARRRTRVDLSVTVALQLYTLRRNRIWLFSPHTIVASHSFFFSSLQWWDCCVYSFLPFVQKWHIYKSLMMDCFFPLFFLLRVCSSSLTLRQNCEHTVSAEPHICFAARLRVTYLSTCAIQNKPLVRLSSEISS